MRQYERAISISPLDLAMNLQTIPSVCFIMISTGGPLRRLA
jgi:hypothetical protein